MDTTIDTRFQERARVIAILVIIAVLLAIIATMIEPFGGFLTILHFIVELASDLTGGLAAFKAMGWIVDVVEARFLGAAA